MGMLISIFSKLKRKKISTKERLEQLDEEIEKIQNLLQRNRQQQRNAAFLLVIASLSLFTICAGIFYLFYMPTKWTERILYIVPFLLFPVLFIALKKALHFIFVTRISKNTRQLDTLKKDKQKILENVMETETYKVAKEILEKFDPNRALVEKDKKKDFQSPPGQELRKRNVSTPVNAAQQQGVRLATPRPQNPSQMMVTPRFVMNGQQRTLPQPRLPSNYVMHGTPQIRASMPNQRTPAPILPRDRSFVDKVAEYFVGDGPNNRYALICKQCAGHNGMALAEEFHFTAFRCCYCQMFNPARKQRMNAPKLESDILRADAAVKESSSDDGGESANSKKIEDGEDDGEDVADKPSKAEDEEEGEKEEEAIALSTNSEKENED